MRSRLMPVVLAGCLSLGGVGVACDREDVRDVKEGVKDVKEGAEDVGNEVEKQIDKMDKDGKDD